MMAYISWQIHHYVCFISEKEHLVINLKGIINMVKILNLLFFAFAIVGGE